MKSQFINGLWQVGHGGNFSSINPANDSVIWSGTEANHEDVNEAVLAAKNSFKQWRNLSFAERMVYLEKFKKLLEEKKGELAQLISSETGKPRWEALTEVVAAIDKLAISQQAYLERCPEKTSISNDAKAVLRFRPIGVMAVFGPFNLPIHLPNGHILPALMAGNCVVFKPSEQTPACGEFLVKLFEEAGLPKGVINLVQGGVEVGKSLAANKNINGILFTGSYKVGVSLHKQLAGQPEKMLALEMGGNNPLVVYKIKDYEAAAYLTILSAFITSGQRCVCARRLIVPKGAEGDAFLTKLIQMSAKISCKNPSENPEPFMGPVISRKVADMVMSEREKILQLGGRELLRMRQNGAFLTPGIIDVTGLNLADEEIFAPLLKVYRVESFEEAIEEANNSSFGLSAGLISDDFACYQKFLAMSNAGIVNWNRQITGAVSSNPFGGIGKSGNYRPSAYFAADYCAYPVASIEKEKVELPGQFLPGVTKE